MSTRAKKFLEKEFGYITFGEMIFSLRKSWDYTQVEFSDKLSISKQDLCNIEKGRKSVSVERAVGFAKALNFPPVVFAQYALQDQLHRAGIKGKVEIRKAS